MTSLATHAPAAQPGPVDHTPEGFNAYNRGHLPGFLGLEVVSVALDRVVGRVPVTSAAMAPHGLVHGGALVTIADSLCGYGTMANLPEGARGFVTVELKCNFLAAGDGGVLLAEATPVHLGRTTHVWDATVSDEASGRLLVMFRCTQMVLL